VVSRIALLPLPNSEAAFSLLVAHTSGFRIGWAAIAKVTPRPKQGQRAARVSKEKAPRRTLSNKVGLFRNAGSDLNTLIG